MTLEARGPPAGLLLVSGKIDTAAPRALRSGRNPASAPQLFRHALHPDRECRDHAMHCRRKAAIAPQALAMEFERLAQTWARLADDLERAQALTESPPESLGNVGVVRRA
jgi:hypothetical protein